MFRINTLLWRSTLIFQVPTFTVIGSNTIMSRVLLSFPPFSFSVSEGKHLHLLWGSAVIRVTWGNWWWVWFSLLYCFPFSCLWVCKGACQGLLWQSLCFIWKRGEEWKGAGKVWPEFLLMFVTMNFTNTGEIVTHVPTKAKPTWGCLINAFVWRGAGSMGDFITY